EARNCTAHAGVPQHTRRKAVVELRIKAPGIWRLARSRPFLHGVAGRKSREPIVRIAGPFDSAPLHSVSAQVRSTTPFRNDRSVAARCKSEQNQAERCWEN